MKVKIYKITDSKQKVSAKLTALPEDFVVQRQNPYLLSQAIHVYRQNMHPGVSRVKTRGEVNLTTRKAYRQKGTGRARHGAYSAPIFVGGGVAHGPKGIRRILDLPKKMRRQALRLSLFLKAKEGKLVGLEGIEKLKKSREVDNVLEIIRKDLGVKRMMVCLSDENKEKFRYFRNLEGVALEEFRNLNAYKVYFSSAVVLDSVFLTGKKQENKKN